MAIKFTNSVYKYETGVNPRGLGHWAFQYRGNDNTLTKLECPFEHYQSGVYVIVWASKVMTLTDAKKEIGDWFKSKGFNGTIAVAS